jgi:hypothetical protein
VGQLLSAGAVNDTASVPWRALAWDANGDGQLTISDAAVWLREIFFLPGDTLLWALSNHAPGMARFFELSPVRYGGLLSASASVVVWLLAVLLIGAACDLLLRMDRAMTARIARAWSETLRRARVTRALLGHRLRSLKGGARPRSGERTVVGELTLSDREMQVLRAHAALEPGYALAAREVASALGVRADEAQRLLKRLMDLRLLEISFASLEDQTAYALSGPGRAFLGQRARPSE